MKLRIILYGYIFYNGSYVPKKDEAEIVVSIFSKYIEGDTIISLANELTGAHIQYSSEKNTWNKNMIYRILTDKRYTGAGEYPRIISDELFLRANEKINPKTDVPVSEEIQWLKYSLICHCCGKQLSRRKTKNGSYRWICLRGCIKYKTITDSDLENEILQKLTDLKNKPKQLISADNTEFSLSVAAKKYENEIERLISESKPSYQLIKSVVLESVSARYDCCRDNGQNDITEIIMDTLQAAQLNFELLKKICNKVAIDNNGEVHLYLKNGKDFI